MSAQTNAPPASYVRSYVNDIPNEPLITVAVSGTSNVTCLTIEEDLPGACAPLDISGDGVYLPGFNAIRWGPYFNTVATNVTYRIAGLPASYPVNGGSWMDGTWFFSPGVTMVTVLPAAGAGGIPSPPPQAPAPIFSPASGSNVPVNVTISDSITNANIYYTLDGTLPTTNSTLYSNSFLLNSAGLIRAVAFASGYTPSAASIAYYCPPAATANAQLTRAVNTNNPTAPIVTFNLVPGSNAICSTLTETLPVGLAAANITGGGNYVASSNAILWGPFFGTNSQTLSYEAVGPSGTYSVQASWSVDGVSGGPDATNLVIVSFSSNTIPSQPLQTATPIFSPQSGGNVPVTVMISDATSNASIYYTLDGSLPTTNTVLYTGGFVLNSPGLVRAVAFASGYSPSAASIAYYGPAAPTANAQVTRSINTNSPTTPIVSFSVVPGAGASCVTVTESLPGGVSATAVSAGGDYLASNNVILWGPFFGTNTLALSYQPIGAPGVYPVQASWSVDGIGDGESAATIVVIASGTGSTIPTAPPQEQMPTLSPPVSSNLPVNVSISCVDPQAQIYFTTDGTLPTVDSLLYTSSLTFNAQTTLRAVAIRAGYINSACSVGEYVAQGRTNSLLLVRSVAGNGTFLPVVNITATPEGSLSCYTVTETVVPGLTPTGLATNAVWNPASGTITWGPFLDNQQRILTYGVDGTSGSYPVAGTGSFDGFGASDTGATALTISDSYFGPPPTNDLGCAGEPLEYTVAVNPAPGVVTVTSASGTVNWGDGTQSLLTQPTMTFQKQFSSPGTYAVTISANWNGANSSGQFSGYATQTDSVQVLSNCNPVITSGPSNELVLAGETAQFTVTVSSPFPAFYRWYFNQTFPFEGPFTTNLTIANVGVQRTGLYSVIVTNQYGSATSSVATLTVINPLVTGATRNPDGSVTLSLSGLPGSTNVIWAATNLEPPASWQPIYTNDNIGSNGIWQFTDTNAGEYPERFYRFSTP